MDDHLYLVPMAVLDTQAVNLLAALAGAGAVMLEEQAVADITAAMLVTLV